MNWVKKWKVEGSTGNVYTVSVDKNNNYGCSCPVWKFRRQECKHIAQVKLNGGQEVKEQKILFAKVRQVQVKDDAILVPLCPFDDAHFSATIAYDLAKLGVSLQKIKDYNNCVKDNSIKAIKDYIEAHGRRIYDKLGYEPGVATTYKVVPV